MLVEERKLGVMLFHFSVELFRAGAIAEHFRRAEEIVQLGDSGFSLMNLRLHVGRFAIGKLSLSAFCFASIALLALFGFFFDRRGFKGG